MQTPVRVTDYSFDYGPERGILAGCNTVDDRLHHAHTHNGLEIGGIRHGSGTMYFGGKRYPVRKGDVFFTDATIPHMVFAHEGSEMGVVWVGTAVGTVLGWGPRDSCLRLYQPFVQLRAGLFPVVARSETLVCRLERAEGLVQARPDRWDLLAWAELIPVLDSVASHAETHAAAHPGQTVRSLARLVPVLKYLHAHFAAPDSVADLAARCDLSRSRFLHIFKEAMHCTPIFYRNQIRAAHAVELLHTTDQPLHAIALACGFDSLSHFRDTFAKHIGTTPGAVRTVHA